MSISLENARDKISGRNLEKNCQETNRKLQEPNSVKKKYSMQLRNSKIKN